MTLRSPEPRSAPWLERLAGFLPRRLRPIELDELLDRLPPVEYQAPADDERLFEEASIPKVLLLMLQVDQEYEYLLCRRLAEHALPRVPDPRNFEPGGGRL
ncbi:MAG TPA: hypothetical protein VFN97_04835 [Actinospica sp.]|nr:hypothetical protein [Actinospica sp.]